MTDSITQAMARDGPKSLFAQYSDQGGSKPRRRGNATTRSAELRARGTRLTCYLNAEADGSGTIVKLPETCDTMGEVLMKVQSQMKLDARMLYASELWTPDGTRIRSFKSLLDAAAQQTPIMVGCGEPFDGMRIPPELLEIYQEGGGRAGSTKVLKRMATKRKEALKEKADQVRLSGHGINSEAVTVARVQAVQDNRINVNEMRHKYMESLLIRAAQQEDLMQSVKQNIEYHKLEAQESKLRVEAAAAERAERMRAERAEQRAEMDHARTEQLAHNKAIANRVKTNRRKAKTHRPQSPSKLKGLSPPVWSVIE